MPSEHNNAHGRELDPQAGPDFTLPAQRRIPVIWVEALCAEVDIATGSLIWSSPHLVDADLDLHRIVATANASNTF